MESRENKIRDEINKFFKAIEKYYASYMNETQQMNLFAEHTPQKEPGNKAAIKKKLNLKDDRGYFMKQVERYRDLSAKAPCSITVEKISEDMDNNQYRLIEVIPPRLHTKKDRKLTADDEIWTIMPYKNLTPEQKYEKYRRILIKLRKKQEARDHPKDNAGAKATQEYEPFKETITRPVKKEDLRITLSTFLNDDGDEEILRNRFYVIKSNLLHSER